MTQIGTIAYLSLIVLLFVLNRDHSERTSKALWIPVWWLLINGSRAVSVWLQMQPPNAGDGSLEGSPLDRAIYFGLIIAGVIALSKRRSACMRILSANPVLLLFILYCGLSTVWADHPDVAFKRWIKCVGDLVMVLIVLTEQNRIAALKKVLSIPVFILIPLSVMLIKYYPDMARYYSPWEGTMFVSGVSTDKNMLGMTCLVFGIGAWWCFVRTYQAEKGKLRNRRLIAYGIVLAMTYWLFQMANSMTSLSCFLLAAGVIALTSMSRFVRRPAIIHLLVLVAVAIPFCVLFLNIGGGALDSMGRNSNLTGRTDIWAGVLSMRGNLLIGVGFESFWVGERLARIWALGGQLLGVNESHNGYIETFLNLGLIGVSLLGLLIITGYRHVVAVFREPELASLGLGFFIIAVVYNFTEAAFKIMCPVWIGFLLATTIVPRVSSGIPEKAAPWDDRSEPMPATAWQ